MSKLLETLRKAVDEAHEQAALGLFITGLGLELFTPFDDTATLGVFFLAMVTLFGSKRYKGTGLNLPDLGGLGDFLPSAPEGEEE